jgi:hypothetical protein
MMNDSLECPLLITNGASQTLREVDLLRNSYDEAWLQEQVYEHPSLVPIAEIEPAFADALAVCRELPTSSGYCDIVLVNSLGYVTFVEFKLWRNAEDRRKVVSQVIDYAKDIAHWDYATFERNCLQAGGDLVFVARCGRERAVFGDR